MRWLIYALVTATVGLAASASALAAGGLIPMTHLVPIRRRHACRGGSRSLDADVADRLPSAR
jgi:hypothetical protein